MGSGKTGKSSVVTLVVGWMMLFAALVFPQTGTPSSRPGPPPDGAWPKNVSAGVWNITVYQPQVESWDGSLIHCRVALSVAAADPRPAGGQTAPIPKVYYGVAWITARTVVDRVSRSAVFQAMRLDKAEFPMLPEQESDFEHLIAERLPNFPRVISLDRLEADVSLSRSEMKLRHIPLNNDPPKFVFSQEPAVLVLVDGPPALRPVGEAPWQYVLNTRAGLLRRLSDGQFFLKLPGNWLSAKAIDGAWSQVPGDVSELEAILRQSMEIRNQGQPVTNGSGDPLSKLPKTVISKVFVSTVPAELIQSDGEPRKRNIPGTTLQEISNSPNQLFCESATGDWFVLLSGRWFRAKAMEGPWTYLASADLPQAFCNIPENDPKGAVLASVPGTPQAREAAIAASIPQMTRVQRSAVRLNVSIDGDPAYSPVSGTSLSFIANADCPVIKADDAEFYALKNGIWFQAVSPRGPWTVAERIPAAIYDIPSNSPLHTATYVHVFDVSPEDVLIGYFPGYFGSYIGPDDLVVFGTGWFYDPWIGNQWFWRPWTWGYGAEIVTGANGRWTWSATVVESPYGTNPWWWNGWNTTGGFGDFWAPWWTGWSGGCWGGYCAWTPYGPFSPTGSNLYNAWSPSTFVNTPQIAALKQDLDNWRKWGEVGGKGTPGAPGFKVQDLYAGKDGRVYARNDGTWQTNDGQEWKDVSASSGGEGVHSLQDEEFGRRLGDSRSK